MIMERNEAQTSRIASLPRALANTEKNRGGTHNLNPSCSTCCAFNLHLNMHSLSLCMYYACTMAQCCIHVALDLHDSCITSASPVHHCVLVFKNTGALIPHAKCRFVALEKYSECAINLHCSVIKSALNQQLHLHQICITSAFNLISSNLH